MDNKLQLQTFLTHLKSGRKQEANEVLREVLASSPSKAGPYALLIGGMLAQNGQYREAVPLYEEAIRVNPGDPAAYFYLGVAYHALKENGECDRIWDQLADHFPDHATAYYQQTLLSTDVTLTKETTVPDNLSDLSYSPAIGILGNSSFGTATQTLQPLSGLQDPSPRLS